jgi:hypothetical protein
MIPPSSEQEMVACSSETCGELLNYTASLEICYFYLGEQCDGHILNSSNFHLTQYIFYLMEVCLTTAPHVSA